jgi:hypothetical protein
LAGPSGVDDIDLVLKLIDDENRVVHFVTGASCVLRIPGKDLSHGQDCEVWTLSPSSHELARFYTGLAAMMPATGITRPRAWSARPNDLAVVTLVRVGDVALLLGADLENASDKRLGWEAVLNHAGRPRSIAAVFKVSHHGSSNGHSDRVWKEMLFAQPIAVVTPYVCLKNPLPTTEDTKRIGG